VSGWHHVHRSVSQQASRYLKPVVMHPRADAFDRFLYVLGCSRNVRALGRMTRPLGSRPKNPGAIANCRRSLRRVNSPANAGASVMISKTSPSNDG